MRRFLKIHGIRPSKFKGQHFLLDEDVLRREVEYAHISGRDVVLEIGAGIGNLTEKLVSKARMVIAVEKDPRLCALLKERGWKNLQLIEGDVLKVRFPKFDKVVSNLPYGISSPITFKLLDYSWKTSVLTYQKEFAQRIVAEPGTRDYSRLTVGVQRFCDAELLEVIPRDAFYPKPKVDSAIIRLKQKRRKGKEDELFLLVVKACFQHRNKKVRNALEKSSKMLGLEKGSFRNISDPLFEKKVFQCSGDEFERITEIVRSLKE
mgnify:CR=1 FL=1